MTIFADEKAEIRYETPCNNNATTFACKSLIINKHYLFSNFMLNLLTYLIIITYLCVVQQLLSFCNNFCFTPKTTYKDTKLWRKSITHCPRKSRME